MFNLGKVSSLDKNFELFFKLEYGLLGRNVAMKYNFSIKLDQEN